MSSEKQISNISDDCQEVLAEKRPFDVSTTAWLVSQGVRYLNTPGKESELAYNRVVEIISRCKKDILETITNLFNKADNGDAPLRWSLLYILGDAGNEDSANFLASIALKKLPESLPDVCESSRDAEMLVSTMAVHALQKVAKRNPKVSEHLLKIVSTNPPQPILIEAVKVAVELGLKEKVKNLLSKDQQWIFDIRKIHVKELKAEPEREDEKERGFIPPKRGLQYTAPQIKICERKEE